MKGTVIRLQTNAILRVFTYLRHFESELETLVKKQTIVKMNRTPGILVSVRTSKYVIDALNVIH